jgi:hypothetical protein
VSDQIRHGGGDHTDGKEQGPRKAAASAARQLVRKESAQCVIASVGMFERRVESATCLSVSNSRNVPFDVGGLCPQCPYLILQAGEPNFRILAAAAGPYRTGCSCDSRGGLRGARGFGATSRALRNAERTSTATRLSPPNSADAPPIVRMSLTTQVSGISIQLCMCAGRPIALVPGELILKCQQGDPST